MMSSMTFDDRRSLMMFALMTFKSAHAHLAGTVPSWRAMSVHANADLICCKGKYINILIIYIDIS